MKFASKSVTPIDESDWVWSNKRYTISVADCLWTICGEVDTLDCDCHGIILVLNKL